MKIIIVFGLLLLPIPAFTQTLRGKVINYRTNEALPFVNVTIAGSTSGTTADVQGRFSLPLHPGDSVVNFTFVGFETHQLRLPVVDNSITIKLKEKSTELHEVVVHAKDNPALRIIREVIRNKKNNDPDELASYSYHAYNKLFMSLEGSADSAITKKQKLIRKFAETHHVFVSENYTEKIHRKPGHNKETVLANRLSGARDPFIAFMATDFQPFSFYSDYLPLFDIKYLNPISAGTEDRYDFTLTDTTYHEADTVFIISFEPIPGKSFQAMKGQLYISTNGFALEHVIAQTADEHALIEFHIQQQYSRISGHWFPVQLNSELKFKQYTLARTHPRYVQRSWLSDIIINDEIPKKKFGLLDVEFAPNANHQSESFWDSHRTDTLAVQERNTYKSYDSAGAKMDAFATFMNLMEGTLVGKYRQGLFYFPGSQMIRINNYEGLRLGLGIETGERISRLFTLNGYFAWGFRDEALKYGGSLQLNLAPAHDGFLRFSYMQDVNEPGAVEYIRRPAGTSNKEALRNLLVYRMDSVRQYKVELGFRPQRSTQLSFFVQQEQRDPAYAYRFRSSEDPSGKLTTYTVAETGLKMRFAWREKYNQVGATKIVTDPAWPLVNLYLSHGSNSFWGGGYNFNKIAIRIEQEWTIRHLGTLSIAADAGKISGRVPYPFLFNGKGSNYNNSFFNSFVISNYFQTMGFYEFASDQFAYLFITHNFGRLNGTASSYFRPELALVHNIGIGSLKNRADHLDIQFNTMTKPFLEGGLQLNNIIRFKYLRLFYFGLGVGAYARYANYTSPIFKDNLAFKFMVTTGF